MARACLRQQLTLSMLVSSVRRTRSLPRLAYTNTRRLSTKQDDPKTVGSHEGKSTKDKVQSGHLDYNLDQLLENIRSAQNSTSVPATEECDRAETDRNAPLSIESVVSFLREERGEELAVIRVPPEREYVSYFVTCVGQGSTHIQRMADNLAARVKEMRDENGQRFSVVVEGRDSEDWVVVQTGDTVVHFLTRDARERYQLEQLWTLGHRYDNQYQTMERNNLESDALK